jgi:hypothetical protein
MASELDTRTKARLNSLTLALSGSWLNVLPNPFLGLSPHNQEFCLAAQYRLGLPVYEAPTSCPTCDRPNDI